MASAMSVTWNSSKHRSQVSCAIAAAVSGDRILAVGFAQFRFLPQRVDALVHVGHEFMEMHAALARDR